MAAIKRSLPRPQQGLIRLAFGLRKIGCGGAALEFKIAWNHSLHETSAEGICLTLNDSCSGFAAAAAVLSCNAPV